MKRRINWTHVVIVVTFCLIAEVAAVRSQSPQKTISLSPEASAEYLKIDGQLVEIVKAYNELAERRRLLLVGAGVAADATPNKPENGIVTFTLRPSPSPSPIK